LAMVTFAKKGVTLVLINFVV